MSIQAMCWVLEHSEAEGYDRCVLMAIANHADASGENAFPRVDLIAREARCHRATVFRSLQRLVDLGELEYETGRGRTYRNTYRIPLWKTTRPVDLEPPEDEKLSTEKVAGCDVKPELKGRSLRQKRSQPATKRSHWSDTEPSVTVNEPVSRARARTDTPTATAEPPIGLGGSIAAPDRCWVCGRLRLGDCLCDRGPILEWGLKPTDLLPDRDDDAGRSPLQERMAQTVARLSHATG